LPLVGRLIASEDMEVAIIGANLEECIIGAVPLVENFLNHVVSFAKLEAGWSLIRLSVGVAFHP
jgi:hypothetical protein